MEHMVCYGVGGGSYSCLPLVTMVLTTIPTSLRSQLGRMRAESHLSTYHPVHPVAEFHKNVSDYLKSVVSMPGSITNAEVKHKTAKVSPSKQLLVTSARLSTW